MGAVRMTAPIHCRASLRQWCNDAFIQTWWRNKLIYILDGPRVSTFTDCFHSVALNLLHDFFIISTALIKMWAVQIWNGHKWLLWKLFVYAWQTRRGSCMIFSLPIEPWGELKITCFCKCNNRNLVKNMQERPPKTAMLFMFSKYCTTNAGNYTRTTRLKAEACFCSFSQWFMWGNIHYEAISFLIRSRFNMFSSRK